LGRRLCQRDRILDRQPDRRRDDLANVLGVVEVEECLPLLPRIRRAADDESVSPSFSADLGEGVIGISRLNHVMRALEAKQFLQLSSSHTTDGPPSAVPCR
jgi:hypothetical protein